MCVCVEREGAPVTAAAPLATPASALLDSPYGLSPEVVVPERGIRDGNHSHRNAPCRVRYALVSVIAGRSTTPTRSLLWCATLHAIQWERRLAAVYRHIYCCLLRW